MNVIWQETLMTTGGRLLGDQVCDFGNPAVEQTAAQEVTVVSPLTHLAVMHVSGVDAAAFLHGQLTSDVRHLAPDQVQYAAWCTAKGRMLASMLVIHGERLYRLQLAADLLTSVSKRLRMFVLRSQVLIAERQDDEQVIGLSGPQALFVLENCGLPAPVTAMTSLPFAAGVVIRLDDSRFEIVAESHAACEVWRQLRACAQPVGPDVWQWLDIRSGIPLITRRTSEEFVPQMLDFELLGGVSFHKGCYPGQEVIARAHYLGKVKRRLYRLHVATPAAAGDALFAVTAPEQPCGMVINASPAPAGGFDALAVLQESFAAGEPLALGAPGGPPVQKIRVTR